jgi:hypothetical protein
MSNTVTGSQQPTSPPPGGSLRPNIYRVDLDRRRDHRYCGRSALVRRWRQHSHCCDCRRSRVRRCRVVAFGTDEVRYWRIRIATSELGRLALRFNAGSGSVMHIEGRRPELGDLSCSPHARRRCWTHSSWGRHERRRRQPLDSLEVSPSGCRQQRRSGRRGPAALRERL